MDVSRYFTTDNPRQVVALTRDAPDWLALAVREAHGDMMPDDWTFAMCQRAAEDIAEAVEGFGEGAWREGAVYDHIPELADSAVDTDPHRLREWFSTYPGAVGDCNKALADRGADRLGVMGIIQRGQYYALDRIYRTIFNAMRDNLQGEA